MEKNYDTKCGDLALAFLVDLDSFNELPVADRKHHADELAHEIQDAIESYLSDSEFV